LMKRLITLLTLPKQMKEGVEPFVLKSKRQLLPQTLPKKRLCLTLISFQRTSVGLMDGVAITLLQRMAK